MLRKQRVEDIMNYLASRKGHLIYIRKLSQDLGLPYSSAHGLLYELAEEKKIDLRAADSGIIVQVVG